jgi:hypothetical protein
MHLEHVDVEELARQLVEFSGGLHIEPCALELRLPTRQGVNTACWVATSVGCKVIDKLARALLRRCRQDQKSYLLTTYFNRQDINRDNAYLFAWPSSVRGGQKKMSPFLTEGGDSPLEWRWGKLENDWYYSRGPDSAEPKSLASYKECRKVYEEMATAFDVGYLFRAFPVGLLRGSVPASRETAIMQVVWQKKVSFERDFKSLLSQGEDAIRTKLSLQVLEELLWLTVKYRDPMSEALALFKETAQAANTFFGHPFHDCASWTGDHLSARHAELSECLSRLGRLAPILARSAEVAVPPCLFPNEPRSCWYLAAVKALAHGFVHPFVLCWLGGADRPPADCPRVELALTRPHRQNGDENLRAVLEVIQAMIWLRAERMKPPSVLAAGPEKTTLALPFERKSSPVEFANCVLGNDQEADGPALAAGPGANYLRKAFQVLKKACDVSVDHKGSESLVTLTFTDRMGSKSREKDFCVNGV